MTRFLFHYHDPDRPDSTCPHDSPECDTVDHPCERCQDDLQCAIDQMCEEVARGEWRWY
jgi:hypothetical protein